MLINLSANAAYGTATPRTTPAATTSSSARSTDLLDDPADWSWQQLRDYVQRSISERHGPQPERDATKTASIFKGFHQRWGTQAGPIARFAFEQQSGYWRSAPVTETRFCRAADDYFARPIAERLTS